MFFKIQDSFLSKAILNLLNPSASDIPPHCSFLTSEMERRQAIKPVLTNSEQPGSWLGEKTFHLSRDVTPSKDENLFHEENLGGAFCSAGTTSGF